MKSLQLSQIWIYPVKSLGGIALPTAQVQPKGLTHDRRWMLVDEQGGFMTQRNYPEMALFHLSTDGARYIISHGSDQRELASGTASDQTFESTIWNDIVHVREVREELSRWFSQKLGLSCRLVYFPENNPRPVDPAYKVNDDQVSLADGFPFLIIGQGSLDALNRRLETPLPMKRFRPNFVFTGGDPHEEDTWKKFTIGANRFAGVKPCARCVMTTVDPETGKKGVEPVKTLATYRRRDNNIYFGQNVIALDHGAVSVGDTITVTDISA